MGNLEDKSVKLKLMKEARLWDEQDSEIISLTHNAGSRILKSFLNEETLAVKATRALYIVNDRGVLIASINSYPQYLNQEYPSFQKTLSGSKGYSWLGKIRLDSKLNEFVIDIAVPIVSHDGDVYGVLHRIYNPKVLFSQVVESVAFGDTGHIMLINSDGVVIDCPILPTGFQLKDPELVKNVTGPKASWVMTKGDGHGSNKNSIIGFSPLSKMMQVHRGSVGAGWFTFAWQSSSELFAPTNKLFFWISLSGLFSILLIGGMGSLASSKIVQPIKQLQVATVRIGRGEHIEPLNIHTNDEIELLAHEINTMNTLLKRSISGLEGKVLEKTKKIRSLQKFTDSILKSVPDIILIFKEDLKVVYANKAFAKLTGVEEDYIIGKKLDQAELPEQNQWNNLTRNLEAFSKMDIASQVASVRDIETIQKKIKDPLAPSQTLKVDSSLTVIILENRTFYYQFFLVDFDSEENLKIGCLMREITEQKALEAQLTMAEKLSGLGTLSAGIAHEMNNPLFAVIGFTEAIINEQDPSRIKSFAEKALRRAKHMSTIISNLTGYVRTNDSMELIDVDLNKIIKTSIEMATMDSYSNDIQTEIDFDQIPTIKAEPSEIQQIFINILRNAVQAMEGKGMLYISTKHLLDNIQIEIRDKGPGIPPQYLAKVFDPFFTTKEQGKGTGLGLNIVHNLVKKYKGSIKVDSKFGEGAKFTITFPVQ
jgi:PAS domain S-box-containing protein